MVASNSVSVNDTTAAVSGIYMDVLGRAVTAPELASDKNDLASGGSLAGLRAYLATTDEAAGKLQSLYTAVVGRAATAGDLSSDEAAISAGTTTLASLRSYFATTNEAAGKLRSLYTDVVGRAITPAELSSDEAAIGAGVTTLASLRTYFTTTAEAAGKLQSLYSLELGRAITPAELTTDQGLIAKGSSLAAIRSYLSTSGEAVNALEKQYEGHFRANDFIASPEPLATQDLATAEQSLAGGSSLLFALSSLPSSVNAINSDYQALLNVAPSSSEVGAAERGAEILGSMGLSTAVDVIAQAATAVVIASPTFVNTINAAFQAAIGRPANAVEFAADKSELTLGYSSEPDNPPTAEVTIDTLKTQIAELSGGVAPVIYPPGVITPQTIAGSPGHVSGLFNNDALISPVAKEAGLSYPSASQAYVYGFNAATDILQVESRQAMDFSALTFTQGTGYEPFVPFSTAISLGGGVVINVDVPASSLTAANFRFV